MHLVHRLFAILLGIKILSGEKNEIFSNIFWSCAQNSNRLPQTQRQASNQKMNREHPRAEM